MQILCNSDWPSKSRMSSCAPAWTNISTHLDWFDSQAICNAVRPNQSWKLTARVECSSKIRSTAGCPASTARCRAVSPVCVTCLITSHGWELPLESSSCTSWVWPCCVAKWRGVRPLLSGSVGSAPAWRSTAKTDLWPCSAALCKAVCPWASVLRGGDVLPGGVNRAAEEIGGVEPCPRIPVSAEEWYDPCSIMWGFEYIGSEMGASRSKKPCCWRCSSSGDGVNALLLRGPQSSSELYGCRSEGNGGGVCCCCLRYDCWYCGEYVCEIELLIPLGVDGCDVTTMFACCVAEDLFAGSFESGGVGGLWELFFPKDLVRVFFWVWVPWAELSSASLRKPIAIVSHWNWYGIVRLPWSRVSRQLTVHLRFRYPLWATRFWARRRSTGSLILAQFSPSTGALYHTNIQISVGEIHRI